jgi:hypothetical protein
MLMWTNLNTIFHKLDKTVIFHRTSSASYQLAPQHEEAECRGGRRLAEQTSRPDDWDGAVCVLALGGGRDFLLRKQELEFSTTTTPIGDHSGGKHKTRYPKLLAHRTASTSSLTMFLPPGWCSCHLVDVLAHLFHQVGSMYHASPPFSIFWP